MTTDATQCPVCRTSYMEVPRKCYRCSYPFGGTEKEQSKFVAQRIMNKGKLEDTKESIRKSRNILFAIAGINVLSAAFTFSNTPEGIVSAILISLIGLIFLVFALTIKRWPLISVIAPLILLVFFYGIDAYIDPSTLARGFVLKLVFLGSLGYCLKNILDTRKILRSS